VGSAVEELAHSRFDVVICDLLMPRGGGREVLQCARGLEPPPPVIVMTGRGEPQVADEMRELGATACLQKPFRLAALTAAVAETVRQRG
jgi:CheY-like chemotaxis protein